MAFVPFSCGLLLRFEGSVMGLLELHGRDHPEGSVEASVVVVAACQATMNWANTSTMNAT